MGQGAGHGAVGRGGTAESVHDLLRWQDRDMCKRHEDPTGVVLDSRTVRAWVNAPKDTTGLDPGKRARAASQALPPMSLA
ncbi:hypothetical protein MOV08_37825 [Streptomyces yunnanensis]|uniref:Transposase n=1 Tax=Streptomyces yunnanensis TaxID=156453 RepID=A0ABY8AHG9_9ACTN|nr:hypothetical protein [Streptomyces yunnanensis]WEB44485.1 hypothetical protein MOV08_37825 [Streptomyces yunnanensis]